MDMEWTSHAKMAGTTPKINKNERGKTTKTFTRSAPDELQSSQNTKLLAKLSCYSTGYLYTSWGDHKLKLLLERSITIKVGVFKSGIWPCKLLDDKLRNVRFAKLPKVGGMVLVRWFSANDTYESCHKFPNDFGNNPLSSYDFSLVTPQWETTKMTTPKSLFWPSKVQTDYQKIVIVTVLATYGGDALNNCIT